MKGLALLLLGWLPFAALAVEPVSGYQLLDPTTRAMQDDPFENPGSWWVDRGEEQFNEPGEEGRACSSCHNEGQRPIDPARVARYPRVDPDSGELRTLQDQIHHCWEARLDNFPLPYDSPEMVALETYVRHLARGEPVNVAIDGPAAPFYEKGRQLYNTRFGQFDLACVHCHDYYAGRMLRGKRLSQGQVNGFPVYRLSKGSLFTFQQRMRDCFIAFRAEPFESGSDELRWLELYVTARGNGLKIETPAIRD